MAAKTLQSTKLIADVYVSFNNKCANGIEQNLPKLKQHLENALMLVTALNTHIGCETAE